MYTKPEIHENELVSFHWHIWNHLCRRCLVICLPETELVDCYFENCTLLALGPVEFHGLYAWDTTFRVAGSASWFTFSTNVSPRSFDGITLDYRSVAMVSSFVEHAWWDYWWEMNGGDIVGNAAFWQQMEAMRQSLVIVQKQEIWRWEDAALALCERLGNEARGHLEQCLRPYLIDPDFLSFSNALRKDESHALG